MGYVLSEELVEGVLKLAREAGEIILDIYNSDFAVRAKDDNSPVTRADEKAEEHILAGLETLAPGIPAIAEESYGRGDRPDISGGVFWLIDALDGTKEFVQRRDEFTVNIALVERGAPIFGAVYAPAIDELYWGHGGRAWFRGPNGKTAAAEVRTPPPDGIIAITSRSHRAGEDDYLKDFQVKGETNRGSSLKFCLIARGEADLYPRFGPTSEWDTAAGHAVLVNAGGSMTQTDGRPFVYGKDNIRNPHFIARGR